MCVYITINPPHRALFLDQVMDHDCAYVGCAISEGNHRSFMCFLLGASACLLVFLSRANVYMRSHPEMGLYECARLTNLRHKLIFWH